jgi:hypothetical protein
MKQNYYKQDDWKALCDTCGRAYKGTELRPQWDGIMACYRCYDSKHPDLEPVIAPKEDPMVPNARPRSEFDNLTFVDTPGLSVWDGVMFNGVDYDTEWTWDDMNVSWDEVTFDDFR